ncbi:MAG: ABC transporter ATP-binding protein, partial [Actinomycetes bacterium]
MSIRAHGQRPGGTGGTPAALVFEGVSKHAGSTVGADSLDLNIPAGELVTLIGPSGCGKSTTLRLAAGLERPDQGIIRVAGEVVADKRRFAEPEKRRVGLVFQDYALFPHMTVAQNVEFGLDRLTRGERRARTGEVLDLVRLGHLAGRYPHELSGGEQQRVALARALAPRPAVVLLDEPFSSLDESLRAQVRRDTVATLKEAGTTGVLVTHDQTEALSVGTRVVVMRGGVIE